MYTRSGRSFPVWQKHKKLKYATIQCTFEEFTKTLYIIVKTGNHLIARILVKYVL